MKNKNPLHREFILESNAIEGVHGDEAFEDAITAWNYALGKKTLEVNNVLHIHKLLMKRLNPRIAGKLRTCDVWIGNQHKKYLGEEHLLWQLRSALSTIWMGIGLANDSGLSNEGIKDAITKEAHVAFENCHPFEDGNGRTGRIIYNWHRMKMGLPIHVIHAGTREQGDYYDWFKK